MYIDSTFLFGYNLTKKQAGNNMDDNILEQSYIYFKKLIKDGAQTVGTGTYSTDSLRYHLLGFFIDYCGFNGFPTVLSDEKFKQQHGASWYHGFGKSEHGKRFLDSFTYHYGAGKQLDGFYLTDIKTEAYKYVQDKLMAEDDKLNYSDISLEEQRSLTAEFKMIGANGIREEKLDEIIKKFDNFEESNIGDENIRQKMETIRKFTMEHKDDAEIILFLDYIMILNKSALAVYLGYDFVRDEVGNTVALNRSKLAVKQSDLIKFSDSSQSEAGAKERDNL